MTSAIRMPLVILTVSAAALTAGPVPAAESPKDETKVVRIAAPARNEPEPAMKYYLLPRPLEQKPGNAILLYDMAQQLLPVEKDPNKAAKLRERIDEYLKIPLDDFPVGEAEELLQRNFHITALRQVRAGAMRREADWGIALEHGFEALLPPNIGDYRRMARLLALRARVEIVQGRYDQAIETIKTGLTMGRHVADGAPILVTTLIGIAIEETMLKCVEDVIGRGGPNLYWALAQLPDPLVDIRPAVAWESQWLVMSSLPLKKAQAGIMSKSEADAMLKSLVDLMAMTGEPDGPGSSERKGSLARVAMVLRFYGPGKKALIRAGRSKKQVDAMPEAQVVVLHLLGDYIRWRDEMFKWFNLPYWQAYAGLSRTEQDFKRWIRAEGRSNPLTALLPALRMSYTVQTRLDRTRVALQTVESIRAFTADNPRLPKTLDELDLPAPVDPMTGKALPYQADGLSFTLDGAVPEGVPARYAVRYQVELTLPERPAATTRPAAPNR